MDTDGIGPKEITGIDPLTIYAPSTNERLRPELEEPYYRDATRRNLVKEPTIFVSGNGEVLGSAGSFDAYVFWPRLRLEHGRPSWMRTTLKRKAVSIPSELATGADLILVQAFRWGEPASAVPVDQILLRSNEKHPRLMLPKGRGYTSFNRPQ